MKKVVCLLTALALLFTAACNEKIEDATHSQKEYRFYSDSARGETDTAFQDVKNAKLWKISGEGEVVIDGTVKRKTLELQEDSLVLDYEITRVMDNANTGKSFSKYDFGMDIYSAEIDDTWWFAYFRRDNGRLCFYMNSVGDKMTTTKNLSEEAMRNIAIDELDRRLDNGWSDIYTEYDYDEYKHNLNAKTPEGASVAYRRIIHGYSTEDYVKVVVSANGEIVCFDARTYGVFDEVAQTLTKERLDAAKDALDKKLLKDSLTNAKIGGYIVCINVMGEVYLKAGFSYDLENGERHQEIVYVSVP